LGFARGKSVPTREQKLSSTIMANNSPPPPDLLAIELNMRCSEDFFSTTSRHGGGGGILRCTLCGCGRQWPEGGGRPRRVAAAANRGHQDGQRDEADGERGDLLPGDPWPCVRLHRTLVCLRAPGVRALLRRPLGYASADHALQGHCYLAWRAMRSSRRPAEIPF